MRLTRVLPSLALVCGAACVPADEAVPLGSVAFTLTATRPTLHGFVTTDGWTAEVEQIHLAFGSMTIGEFNVAERCAYRGRGREHDVVFDPRLGIVQTFNGLEGGRCPDVGIVLAVPSDISAPGYGVTVQDLLEMRRRSQHLLVRATFRRDAEAHRIELAFDSRAATRFGGCQVQTSDGVARGVTIVPNERQEITVRLGIEAFFREAVSATALLRLAPFVDADAQGDADGVTTTDEIDAYDLRSARAFSSFYELPDGSRRGSFGDYVRAQLRFAFTFRDAGQCVGNPP